MVSVTPTDPAVLSRFRHLYERFVGRGDLVFDVGANIGENSALFASLGARVVAVEPLPECAPLLAGVEVERCALGATEGELELHVCSAALDISSGSPDWIGAMSDAGLATGPWDRRLTAPMTTLDALIARHGHSRFVKVDVEGYELDVLLGLSRHVETLSIETHRATLDKALACVARLDYLGFRRFAASPGHSAELSPWTDADGARAAVAEIEWGDLYAR
jgi:FkbM family methyltransferase